MAGAAPERGQVIPAQRVWQVEVPELEAFCMRYLNFVVPGKSGLLVHDIQELRCWGPLALFDA